MSTRRSTRRFTRLVTAVALLASSSILGSALIGTSAASAADNGAAATPPAGWSSWSFVRNTPTDAKIKAQAQALHDSGLVGHGYTYLNIDDFYYLNPSQTVDQYGRWVIDTAKFPNGMANVGAYVHNLGEKFGLYLTPGIPVAAYNQNTPIEGTSFHARDIVSDTSRYEANYNFGNGAMYFIDWGKNPAAAQAFVNSWARLLASYGADYLKIDGVGTGDQDDVIGWSKALAASGRTIHFGLSNGLARDHAATWRQYANSWRTEGDIECYCSTLTNWNNVSSRWNDLPAWAAWAGPGGWNDPDSIEVGNGTSTGLSPDERRSQITLWSISAASLLLGTDLTHLDSGDLALLTNDEVLAIDRAGNAAIPVSQSSQQQVWRAPGPNGTTTVALFNLSGATATVTANFTDVGFTGNAAVRDLWSHTDLGTSANSFSRSLPAHGSALLRLTPAAGVTPTGGPLVSALSARCADDPHSTTTNGTQVIVYDCNNQTNQRVTYSSSTKALKLMGKCFDAHDNQTAVGTHVELYDCHGGANQQWNVNANGTITGVQSGICLDVTGVTNPNESGLELWTCNGGGNQRWMLGAGVRVA